MRRRDFLGVLGGGAAAAWPLAARAQQTVPVAQHEAHSFFRLIAVLCLTAASLADFTAYTQKISRAVAADRIVPLRDLSIYDHFRPAFSLPYVLLDRQSSIFAPAVIMASLVIALPLPPRRPKSAVSTGLLNDAQIAGIKSRLGLSSEQAEHWPAVAEALRDIARRHLQGHGKYPNRVAPRIEVKSPEVQRLIEASVPLIRQLREDQKREVRKLVRMIGLETVASHI